MAEESSFQGLTLKNSLTVVEAVGPSFPPPLLPRASFFPEAGRPQLLEEFALGLLHTLGGFGIADRRGDAL